MNPSSGKYLILVAGGVGARMGSNLPKQFASIKGKPVFVHAIDAFLSFDKNIRIVIAIHPEMEKLLRKNLAKYLPYITPQIVHGGKTRFHSVKNALQVLPDNNNIVAIHDAARPLVSKDTIKKCFTMAQKKGNAIPVYPVSESIRKVRNGLSNPVDRTELAIVQTPQCFRLADIKKAYTNRFRKKFTDDATVLEEMGEKIYLVEGNRENIKITYPADLKIVKTLLQD